VSLLEKRGHTVVAPDLPSHGRDKTPISAVSLQSYVERVCQVVDAQAGSLVLVRHSMGGAIITQVAEYRPDKIKLLVYLAAFLLGNGESLFQIARGDPETSVLPNLVFTEDQSYSTVKEKALKDLFYGDCSDEDIALARALLVPQSMAPLATPVHTTQQNFGRIPRVYIECLQDRAISPSVQKKMYTALPCQKVISMDRSHSPFFSAPEELAAHLASL